MAMGRKTPEHRRLRVYEQWQGNEVKKRSLSCLETRLVGTTLIPCTLYARYLSTLDSTHTEQWNPAVSSVQSFNTHCAL